MSHAKKLIERFERTERFERPGVVVQAPSLLSVRPPFSSTGLSL